MGKMGAVARLCFFLLCFFSVVAVLVGGTAIGEKVQILDSNNCWVDASTFSVEFSGTEENDFSLAVGRNGEAWVVWKDEKDELQWTSEKEEKRLNFFRFDYRDSTLNEDAQIVLLEIMGTHFGLKKGHIEVGLKNPTRMVRVTKKLYDLASSEAYIFDMEDEYKLYMNLRSCQKDFPNKRLYDVTWDLHNKKFILDFKDIPKRKNEDELKVVETSRGAQRKKRKMIKN